jgi:putative transposase
MTRLARVVAVGVPHHVTRRGNARHYILDADADRKVYLDLLRQSIELHGLALVGYCLMSNHVHLIAIPDGRYAAYWNAVHHSSGHVWQGRFYSCPLDESHLWKALRYADLNPVRAGLVAKAERWEWSSAAAHCGVTQPDGCLAMELWQAHWSAFNWRTFLATGETESELMTIHQSTHTGRPLGTREFIGSLEHEMHRNLTAQKRGRPRKAAAEETQCTLVFEP